MPTPASARAVVIGRPAISQGSHFTRFTSTKIQILTQKQSRKAARNTGLKYPGGFGPQNHRRRLQVLILLALLVQKHKS